MRVPPALPGRHQNCSSWSGDELEDGEVTAGRLFSKEEATLWRRETRLVMSGVEQRTSTRARCPLWPSGSKAAPNTRSFAALLRNTSAIWNWSESQVRWRLDAARA